MPELRSFTREHFEGALPLFAAEEWQTYTAEPERAYRALAAPGSITLVAVDQATVVAQVQLQSDGEIQAHLFALVVAEGRRRRGIARRLRGVRFRALRLSRECLTPAGDAAPSNSRSVLQAGGRAPTDGGL